MRDVAGLEREQPGDVEVVDPEEGDVVGDLVESDGHVRGEDEGAARAVGGVGIVLPLFLRYLRSENTIIYRIYSRT